MLAPGAMTVDGMQPILGQVESCQWTSMLGHLVRACHRESGGNTTLDAQIGQINVHIRDNDNSALLLH